MEKNKKILNEFTKQINKSKKEAVPQAEIDQYFALIKQSIQDDIKDGQKEVVARNLTLGIGVHAGDYPKHLILNGRNEGWKYITRYLLWQSYILEKLFTYKEVSSRSIGGIIGLSLLWNMSDLAKLSRDYFQLLFEEDRQKYMQRETHHLFLAILYDLNESGTVNYGLYSYLPDGNVYKRFLDHWASTDIKILGDLLVEMCDFHIYSALDTKNKFSEILSLNYIPYEIRLVEKMRSKQGLMNIKIDHPLLETNLAKIPQSMIEWDLSQDEIYQFLIKRE